VDKYLCGRPRLRLQHSPTPKITEFSQKLPTSYQALITYVSLHNYTN